jgi:hypothetical protein
MLGSEVVATGLGQMDAGQTLVVSLVSASGRRLAEAEAPLSSDRTWQATIQAPIHVSGPAQLQASIRDQDGSVLARDHSGVILVVDTASDRFLTLDRPLDGADAVSGYYLFFDGYAQQPVGGVTLALWTEDCQSEVARQFFPLRGSTYWHGFLLIPRDLTGPACAVAYFGLPDAPDEWREAVVTVNVLAPDDDEARGITLGYPPPGRTLLAGRSYAAYGTAFNAPDDEVEVILLLANGRVLDQESATVDIWGYWEVALRVPADAEGPATIQASIGAPGDEHYSESVSPVVIAPATGQ